MYSYVGVLFGKDNKVVKLCVVGKTVAVIASIVCQPKDTFTIQFQPARYKHLPEVGSREMRVMVISRN